MLRACVVAFIIGCLGFAPQATIAQGMPPPQPDASVAIIAFGCSLSSGYFTLTGFEFTEISTGDSDDDGWTTDAYGATTAVKAVEGGPAIDPVNDTITVTVTASDEMPDDETVTMTGSLDAQGQTQSAAGYAASDVGLATGYATGNTNYDFYTYDDPESGSEASASPVMPGSDYQFYGSAYAEATYGS